MEFEEKKKIEAEATEETFNHNLILNEIFINDSLVCFRYRIQKGCENDYDFGVKTENNISFYWTRVPTKEGEKKFTSNQFYIVKKSDYVDLIKPALLKLEISLKMQTLHQLRAKEIIDYHSYQWTEGTNIAYTTEKKNGKERTWLACSSKKFFEKVLPQFTGETTTKKEQKFEIKFE